jgi:hypothetical protein
LSLATGPTANCWGLQVDETSLHEQEATVELNGWKFDKNAKDISGMYSRAVKYFVSGLDVRKTRFPVT